MPAEVAARQVLDSMACGRRRIVSTGKAKWLALMVRLMPERYPDLVARKNSQPAGESGATD